MEFIQRRIDGPSVHMTANFTGEVYNDRLLDVPGRLRIGNVFFTPGARTHWHSHDDGQVLHVVAGQGRVASEGESVHVMKPGDIVWTPPGELHWHGADTDSYMLHTAVTLGDAQWGREVTDEEYRG